LTGAADQQNLVLTSITIGEARMSRRMKAFRFIEYFVLWFALFYVAFLAISAFVFPLIPR